MNGQRRTLLALTVVVLIDGCAKSAPPPARANTKIFEPVYRAAKTVQGATQSGVSYMKYGELLQSLSTELSIARDQVSVNPADRELLAAFEQVYRDYSAAASLWKLKTEASGELWKGEIPIEFIGKNSSPEGKAIATGYRLPISERRAPYTNTTYLAIPGESMQMVWVYADDSLKTATDMFYGRPPAKSPIDRTSAPPPINRLKAPEPEPVSPPSKKRASKPDLPDAIHVRLQPDDIRYHSSGCAQLKGAGQDTTLQDAVTAHTACPVCKPPLVKNGVVVWQ